MEAFNSLILILDATLRVATPLIFAALAGMFSERTGIVNIALEGKILASAFAGAAAAYVTNSPWMGLLAGVANSGAPSSLLFMADGLHRLEPGGLSCRINRGRKCHGYAGEEDENHVQRMQGHREPVHEVHVRRNLDDLIGVQSPREDAPEGRSH